MNTIARGALRSGRRWIVLALLACAAGAGGLVAQNASSTWRIEAGGGGGVSLSGHDLSETWDPAGLAVASMEWRVSNGAWVGAAWTGAWLEGAPGGDSRHALMLVGTLEPGGGPLWLRAGAGAALSTIADVDGPPEPPAVGDAVVAIGSTMGASLSAGLGVDLPLSASVSVDPTADLLVQRVEGRTLTLLGLTARLRVRF